MDLRVQFSVAIVVAVVVGEVVSIVYYSNVFPWGQHESNRYFISALVADIGLAFLLQWLIRNYWAIRNWQDAAMMGVGLALVFVCFEAPHAVWDHRSLSRFFFHSLHKFLLIFVMALCLWQFKNY